MRRAIITILVALSWRIVKSNEVPPESINLASSIYHFYKPSGIVIVYDAHDIDFKQQQSLFRAVRQFSSESILSQVVTYNQFKILVHSTSSYEDGNNQDIRWLQPLDPLYMLIVREEENLHHFNDVSTCLTDEVTSSPWFIYVVNDEEESNYFDCAEPQGNPFNLELDSRVTVKCSNDTNLRRYYSVWGNETKVVSLDNWTPDNSLNSQDMKNQYHRTARLDWQFTLTVAQQNSTSVDFNKNHHEFVNEVIKVLSEYTVFNFNVVIQEDVLGYRTESNEWIGLMKIMKEKQVDMAAVLFSMSNTRMLVIDFTLPLIRAKCGIYAKLPESTNIKWSAYFDVLGSTAWLIIVILILIMSIMLALLKEKFKRFTVSAILFFENFINIWGVYTQQGSTEASMTTAVQIFYFSMFVSSLILNAVYSATITSYITVMTPTLPFSNYSEFERDKEYKVVVIKGSRDEDLITSTNWDKVLSPLRGRLEKQNLLPIYAYEGFVKACHEKTAFYTNDIYYEGIIEKAPCNLGFLTTARFEFLSLALTKNSPFTKTINYFILRLMNNGIINRLKRHYFYKYIKLPDNKPNYITLWEIVPILSIWGLGVLASLFIFLIEIAVQGLYSNSRKRNKVKFSNLLRIKKKRG